MGFSIPHQIIKALLPSASNAQTDDWAGLVDRADQIYMNRQHDCHGRTLNNGHADEYEGNWLKNWVSDGFAQRLHPKEAALVPLFAKLTQPLEEKDRAWSTFDYAPVRWDSIQGEFKGVDLQKLAKRIAATSLESLDGDSTMLSIRALADASHAHTPNELLAIDELMKRYFVRDVSFTAFEDASAGVKATFTARETPYAIARKCDNKSNYSVLSSLGELIVQAPVDSKVSVVPLDCHGKWSDKPLSAEVGPSGEVRFDMTNVAPSTVKLAFYVLHDEDGSGPNMPTVKAKSSLPMPSKDFYTTIDNSERIARLKQRLTGAAA